MIKHKRVGRWTYIHWMDQVKEFGHKCVQCGAGKLKRYYLTRGTFDTLNAFYVLPRVRCRICYHGEAKG